MAWTLVCAASATWEIRKIDPAVRRRLYAALQKLHEEPDRGKPLQFSLRGLRSWRKGDYRIVDRVVETRIEIRIVAIGNRRDLYSKLHAAL